MSKTVVVRYETRPDAAQENQELVEKVFAELNATNPDGLRYASFLLADGVTFVHVAQVDGPENPLFQLSSFAEFQRQIGSRTVGPPDSSDATIVGSYGFLS